MQGIQLSFKVSFLVNWLVYTIMAFIMSSFIHFILKFRDWCKGYYSKLVIHSQFKNTLSPVMVQAFLSQSTCLLTNNSNCKFTFLFFLCLTTYLLKLMKRNTNSITIMHSIQNQFIHQCSQKDKSVSLQYHQSQVKLFHMLQNKHTS